MSIPPANWELLYREYFPVVYRALVGALFDRERARDALQDAFEEGLRRPPDDQRNVPGWLFRVALRKARRARRHVVVPLQLDTPARDDQERTLDRLEAGRLLGLLTERQRAIVIAHYWLGMTQEEVARSFGLQRGSVGATITQSLEKMRRDGRKVLNAQ